MRPNSASGRGAEPCDAGRHAHLPGLRPTLAVEGLDGVESARSMDQRCCDDQVMKMGAWPGIAEPVSSRSNAGWRRSRDPTSGIEKALEQADRFLNTSDAER